MAKAEYTYSVNYNDKIVVIEDLDSGSMSVTNDIERVLDEIHNNEKARLDLDFSIIYKDSEGVWDGYDWRSNYFIHLGCQNIQEAVQKVLQKRLK